MKVVLSHAPNPDVRGGYWGDKPRKKREEIPVADFGQASKACRDYIAEYELGCGNWTGGQIFDDSGRQIASVSYNGRVLDMGGQEIVDCDSCPTGPPMGGGR